MTGLHPFGACEAPGCGKALPAPELSAWAGKEVRRYCDPLCRSRANHARNPRPPKVHAPRPCRRCQASFTPARGSQIFCSKDCCDRSKRAAQEEARVVGDAATRESARAVARRRVAAGERCPNCRAYLGADETLLYCAKRCGFFELLTAKARDPRADADTPDPDQETEEMSLEEVHDTEEETTSDDRPAPTYATPRGEATRTKIRELLAEGPASTPDLAARLGLDRSGVLRHLRAMPEAKTTGKGKSTLWQLVDEARPVEVKVAWREPRAKPAPAPERKPSGLVGLRRQIAELSPADFDALLVDLSALAKAHAALRAAQEALRG